MKGYKIKIYPNKSQQQALDRNFGCCRWVYNKMIEINQKKYHRTGKSLSGYEMANYLPKLKKQFPWLKEANNQSLQASCCNLNNAYRRFFKKQGSYPRFKNKSNKQSFKTIGNTYLKENNIIRLPKVDTMKFRGSDKPSGKTKTFIISKDCTGYYASITIEEDNKEIVKKQEVKNILGIDLGIKDYAILNNGTKFGNKKFLNKEKRKLKKQQQAFSRKKKGSKKREQAKLRLARLHKKIANKRKDYAHKISRKIINSCDNQTAISIENLNVIGMMKNHKLAKSIADCGWSQFITFLDYKAKDIGKQVIRIDRFYPSTKTCSSCGFVNQNLTLQDRSWKCPKCKIRHDRDINASINIAMEGARILNSLSKSESGENISLEEILQNIQSSSLCEADKLLIGACTSIRTLRG